jgi:type II secretory pathway predicted ATPase ExeA
MDTQELGLNEKPFSAAPNVAAYYAAQPIEHARRQLERCIDRAEGIGVVIAPAGTGKSLLLSLLAEAFRDRFHVAHLAGANIESRRSLLQSILFELGLAYRGLEEGELRLALMDHLQPSRECPHGMLLLVDEAHALPLKLLEEVRLLTNLVREGSPRVRLVLAGLPSFEERLANPKLEALNQRIAVRSYLQAFSGQETTGYIAQEIARCGGLSERLFATDALRAIQIATTGIPRLVNQLCDHALTLATKLPLRADAIQLAWSDLQQLPAPWTEPATAATAAIEFGSLDEPEFEAQEAPAVVDPTIAAPAALTPSVEVLFGDDFEEEETVAQQIVVGERPSLSAPAQSVVAIEPDMPILKLAPLADKASAETAASEDFDPVYPEPEADVEPAHARIVAIDAAERSVPRGHTAGPLAGRFKNLFSSLRTKGK